MRIFLPGAGPGDGSVCSMARLRKPKIVRRLDFVTRSASSTAAAASKLTTASLCCTRTCFREPMSFSGKRRPTSLRRFAQANRRPKPASHNLAHSLEKSVMSNMPPGPCAATSSSCCGPSAFNSKHISAESSTWSESGWLSANFTLDVPRSIPVRKIKTDCWFCPQQLRRPVHRVRALR